MPSGKNEDELGRPADIYRGRIPPPYRGRKDQGNGGVFQESSSREAGVVVRATVEAFGPVGDTEMNIMVKWPAGNNIGASPKEQRERLAQPPGIDTNVGDNR